MRSPKTLVDAERMQNLVECVDLTSNLPGSIIEFGVYKGGSLHRIVETGTDKEIYAIDSFVGLPEKTDGVDLHQVGNFADTSYETVRNLFIARSNVKVIKGIFPRDFTTFDPGPLALAHIDVDMYVSTLACLRFVDKRLVSDGIILCDDYGCDWCPGARLAVHEFLAETGIRYTMMKTVNSQIMIRRT